jgi:CRISPR/Cas system-associated exonuclease Cas4 (RecB family)
MINLSYTLLSQWDWAKKVQDKDQKEVAKEKALRMYFGFPVKIPEEQLKRMQLGKSIHDEIADKRICLTKEMDENGEWEMGRDGNKFRLEIPDLDIIFTVKIDYLHRSKGFFVDYKLGVSDKMQLYAYAYVLEQMGEHMNYAKFLAVDRVDDKIVLIKEKIATYILTPRKLEIAKNWIYEVGGELRNEIVNSSFYKTNDGL